MLARRNALPTVFGTNWFDEFDRITDDIFSRWPRVQHASGASRFASYEDENGYRMQVTLPEGVTADQINAEVKDGVLTLSIEKPEVPTQKVEITQGQTEE